MAHSLNRVWVHGIWGTKYRQDFIVPDKEVIIYDLIKKEFKNYHCPALIVNGMPDHIHCLFQLFPKWSLVKVFKQIKGAVSHAINNEGFTDIHFSWQTGYASFSVSETRLENVYRYIENQKEYHKKKSLLDEYYELHAFSSMNEDYFR
jgi:REP element-mobilizing transposase RayT